MAIQKVALITAGTAGLGAQIARVLAPDFRVCINYANNTTRAQELLSELHEIPVTSNPNGNTPSGPRFHSIRADVGSRPALQALVTETVQTFGRLDVVISNAGWTRLTDFNNLDDNVLESDWDKCFLYNVKAHLWLMHAARPALEASEGAFVTTASVAGVKPGGSSLAYSVTKAAAVHLTKALAGICGPGVRVNAVSPGLLLTEWGLQFPEEKREKAREATRLKRLPTVEDVADQVRVLALSKSVTGQNIVVDSGTSV
ncbi:hypothetical protein MBLNU230_g5832t1 [Neophaeotheca triangularis]